MIVTKLQSLSIEIKFLSLKLTSTKLTNNDYEVVVHLSYDRKQNVLPKSSLYDENNNYTKYSYRNYYFTHVNIGPHLNPRTFYLPECMKNAVYTTNRRTKHQLCTRIMVFCPAATGSAARFYKTKLKLCELCMPFFRNNVQKGS